MQRGFYADLAVVRDLEIFMQRAQNLFEVRLTKDARRAAAEVDAFDAFGVEVGHLAVVFDLADQKFSVFVQLVAEF